MREGGEVNTQPDTNTMKGRHAVELASKHCRIQESNRLHYEPHWRDTEIVKGRFDWRTYDHRIHPEDLAKLPEDKFPAPMQIETVTLKNFDVIDVIRVNDKVRQLVHAINGLKE